MEGRDMAVATAPKPNPKSKTKLKPLGSRVVVKALEREEMTKSGLVLPDTAKEKPMEGKVLAVGPGGLDRNRNMAKQLEFTQEARASLKAGVDKMANAVKTTLGPKGRNVAVDKKFGAPTVTHDGVTVAREIELEDPFENMGARLLVEVATKTNDVAGDGTTTATVLAQSIVHEGLKMVAAGANPMLLKRGLDKGAEALVAGLKSLAK